MNALNKEILRLAIPSILAGLTVPLVGMVDIAVAGHLQGTGGAAAFIGGISVGSMLFDLLYWNFSFLRAGTGGLTAQAFGRNNPKECARLLTRGVGLSLAIALLVLAIQWPFVQLAFLVVDASEEVRALALQYFFIRIWAAPATLSLMALRGWFIGMQDSVSSMLTDLVVNGTNILLSILLALGAGAWPGLGFKGVALGTLIGQYTGLLFAALTILVKYRSLFGGFTRDDVRTAFLGREIRRFFSLNTDLFFRSLALTAIYIGFTTLSAHYGDMTLAAGAILMKLLMVFSFFTDGFAYAGQALVGKFIGMGSHEMTRKSVRCVFAWSMVIAVGFIFIYQFGGMQMLRIMTSDGSVVEACRPYLPWLILMPPLGCAAFTWDGIYEGATSSRPVRNAMLGAMAGFYLTWWLLKALCLPVEGASIDPLTLGGAALHLLMAAYFIHLLVRTVWLSVLYRRSILDQPFTRYSSSEV
ncbi:MAG: MATE family efflux transporter [Bacteroidales bacterium]|nr:MATE family efflux transporter [Bacteroidales bacterium]